MTSDDEFDDIVRRLDVNFPFPTDNDSGDDEGLNTEDVYGPAASADIDAYDGSEIDDSVSAVDDSDRMLPGDDTSYRQPPPWSNQPLSMPRFIAVCGVIAGPTLLILATVSGIILPRTIAYGLALIFVACAIWLISQLPERGRGRPDSPDDGVEL